MAQTWTQIIRPPKDGELVNQEVAGRAIKSLQERTDYLYQHLTDFSAANGKLVIQNAPIDSGVELGDWLYFDTASGKYNKAIAEGVYNTTKKSYEATDRAYVVGLCIAKSGGLASILMHGWIQSLSALGIAGANMIQSPEDYAEGRFYLSSRSAGKMSATGVAPIVQLGFFSGDTAFVSPLQKDIFESHTHFSTLLPSKPAASQNNAQTGLKTYTGNVQHVDYFYSSASPAASAPSGIVMAIKGNGTTAAPSFGAEFRIEIYRTNADKMGVQIFVDDIITPNLIDIDDPTSGHAYSPGIADMDWPAYGEWVAIPNTGVSVAFVNLTTPGSGGLPDDIKTAIAKNTSRFKVFYPNDTIGWTNTNPYDGAYASGTNFRYVREFDTTLNAIWPPIPVETASIENNGFRLVAGTDFKCVPQDLFWIPNGIDTGSSKAYGPWSYDYPGTNSSYAKRLEMFFSKANINTAKSVVTSLQSASSAITVKDCFTGENATAGNLEIALNLDLSTISGSAASTCIASVDPDTQKFVTSPLVSGIVAGSGLQVSSATGVVTISSNVFQSSGEVSIVSLKNAKESLVAGVTPTISFLDPSAAKCQAVAKIKMPKDIPTTPVLTVSSSVFGSKSASGVAVFKAVYYVMRDGTNLSAFIEANAFATQVWQVTFSSYTANTILSGAFPASGNIVSASGLAGVSLSTGKVNYGGSTHSDVALQEGDTVLMVLERVASYGGIVTDNYSNAEVGLTNITWQIA